jgi:hypothetical protein
MVAGHQTHAHAQRWKKGARDPSEVGFSKTRGRTSIQNRSANEPARPPSLDGRRYIALITYDAFGKPSRGSRSASARVKQKSNGNRTWLDLGDAPPHREPHLVDKCLAPTKGVHRAVPIDLKKLSPESRRVEGDDLLNAQSACPASGHRRPPNRHLQITAESQQGRAEQCQCARARLARRGEGVANPSLPTAAGRGRADAGM